MEKKPLLVEIGVEELPHSFIPGTLEQLEELFLGKLSENRLGHGEVVRYATPRRIALLVKGLSCMQEDYKKEKRGPAVDKAYTPDGKPTKALLGFARSNQVDPEETIIKHAGNKKYVFLVREIKGRPAQEVLGDILAKVITGLRFAKTMKWEESCFFFARPIRWLVYLFGDQVIPCRIAGIEADRYTWAHRTFSRGPVRLEEPLEYEKKLKEASVIPSREERKRIIVEKVQKIASQYHFRVPEQAEVLFEYNTDLVEFPGVVMGTFDQQFLELPPEVLISEMVEHQYYFPMEKQKGGELCNFFMVVSNIEDNSESIAGYQRVLRARLEDGKFFFEEDQKKHFSEYQDKLRRVAFHQKLGTIYDKIQRIHQISDYLIQTLGLDSKVRDYIQETVSLCKNDLVTLMVNEFPNLQGVMGYYYALSSGYPHRVALGIKEHYQPRYASDTLPSASEGAVTGLADRLDTIMGMFSLGLKPKGSSDPFGLRRNAMAIVKIIIALRLDFSLQKLVHKSMPLYQGSPDVIAEIEDFLVNRIRSIFSDMGFPYDEIDASMPGVLQNVYEMYRRVSALHQLRGDREFENLLVSFKRMSNIVQGEKDFFFSEQLLEQKEEIQLYQHFQEVRETIVTNIKTRNYQEVYRVLSTFKPFVDNFFDNVLVMDENPRLKKNRIGLLKDIINVFSDIVDFSKIVQAGE
ncbi:MAG: glycine--tRNA ligase subunit beta [Spirochaetota bacterium]